MTRSRYRVIHLILWEVRLVPLYQAYLLCGDERSEDLVGP
jgi:hypothetical protein